MNRILALIIFSIAFLAFKPDEEEVKSDAILFHGYTMWVDSTLSKAQYDENLVYEHIDTPLYVLDDSGGVFPVTSFDFVYKEVGVYENAEGKKEVMCNTRLVYCSGNRIDTAWRRALKEQLAWGDTLEFVNVKYRKEDKNRQARPLKVYMNMPKRLRKR